MLDSSGEQVCEPQACCHGGSCLREHTGGHCESAWPALLAIGCCQEWEVTTLRGGMAVTLSCVVNAQGNQEAFEYVLSALGEAEAGETTRYEPMCGLKPQKTCC